MFKYKITIFMIEDNLLQHGFPNGGSVVDEKLINNYIKLNINKWGCMIIAK